MRCKTVLSRLDDHVDGVLAVAESEAIREHLDLCANCRETAMAAKFASSTLAAWHDAEPPADGYEKILERLASLPLEAFERKSAPAPKPILDLARARRVATGGLAAAAAVLAALVVVKNENARPAHHVREATANVPTVPASFFQGYQFDDGLVHRRVGPAPLRPFGVEPSLDEQFAGSTR